MNIELVDLTENDFYIIKEIYDYYIINSTATFHTEMISIDELKDAIPVNHPKYKSFLIKNSNDICGYCYISCYKKRQAYDRTAEITLYLKSEYHGLGIGKQTIEKLEYIAENLGIKVLIGIISEENKPSIKLFENCGYEKCAHFKKVGEKFNRILDVVAYQKILG
jgi:phosphinothricin acetyltransferase